MRIDLDIIYQDEDMIAVNKPSGLLSVPGRGEDKKDSVASRIQKVYPRAEVAHRLDWFTSGVMLLGLHKPAVRQLHKQFRDRTVDKNYMAVLYGNLKSSQGIVDLPLRCDWENRPKQMVDLLQGKQAQTIYQVVNRQNNATRVKVTPITGRSHQIRVHMQMIGHPIAGDQLYGDLYSKNMASRLLLHAEKLLITHPFSDEQIELIAPCPF